MPLLLLFLGLLWGGDLIAQNRPNLKQLEFMSGCWSGALDPATTVEEIWTTTSPNLMLATTRYLDRDGKATGWEFTRIALTDSSAVFAAAGNGAPEEVYQLKTLVDEFVVFENPDKKFPQRISYRLASDGSLIPRNEGDGVPSVEVRMRRIRCPGERR